MNNTINFNELFSQIRLSSYDNNIVKHYDNLKCVGKITPKLATLCRRKNKISIWKNKTSIKVEILFFYKP
ncbi:hypothetical protein DCB61_02855 [Campylobacter jejuni]|nr:hypothetical protein [Campylobacter jejuni]